MVKKERSICIALIFSLILLLLYNQWVLSKIRTEVNHLEQDREILVELIETERQILIETESNNQREIEALLKRLEELEYIIGRYKVSSQKTGLDLGILVFIDDKARDLEVDPAILLGLIQVESNFNPDATNLNTNGTSDRGLMQINSGTSKWLWGRAFPEEPYDVCKLYDPKINITLGTLYLQDMLIRYGDIEKALTAYNKGPGGLERWVKKHGTYNSGYSRSVLTRSRALTQ